jgi:type IV secretory pathway VirB10-like protein
MNQRFLMWGLASITFVVTLGITSWNDGLWPSEVTTPTRAHGTRTASLTADDTSDVPFRPFAPTHVAPPSAPVEKVAAVTPPPPPPVEPVAPQEAPLPTDEPSTQVSAQELDEADFQAHRDRAAEHSSRAR